MGVKWSIPRVFSRENKTCAEILSTVFTALPSQIRTFCTNWPIDAGAKTFFWWITGTTLKTNLVWTIPATISHRIFLHFELSGNREWMLVEKCLQNICQFWVSFVNILLGFSVLPENSLMLPPFSLCDWSQRVLNGWYAGFKIYICFTHWLVFQSIHVFT